MLDLRVLFVSVSMHRMDPVTLLMISGIDLTS